MSSLPGYLQLHIWHRFHFHFLIKKVSDKDDCDGDHDDQDKENGDGDCCLYQHSLSQHHHTLIVEMIKGRNANIGKMLIVDLQS